MAAVIRVVVKEGMGDVPQSGIWVNQTFEECYDGAPLPETEYTLVEGAHFPPAVHKTIWSLVRATRHKGD